MTYHGDMETIPCGCGCGTMIPKYDTSRKRERKYAYRHNPKKHDPGTCAECGTSFQPRHGTTKYCSWECSVVGRGKARRRRVVSVCKVCGEDFEHHQFREAKYCGKKCWSRRAGRGKTKCPYCGRVFRRRWKGHTYCSRSCAGSDRTGDRARAWKGGSSLQTERGRLSGPLSKWRAAVFHRDSYRCRLCGTSGPIHAHHIRSFAEYPDLRLIVTNGMTLCIDCHGFYHDKNFHRRNKTCCDCGVETTGRGLRCRSCGIRHWHQTRGRENQLHLFFEEHSPLADSI